MSKKKKKSGKNHSLEKLILATATLNLIKAAIDTPLGNKKIGEIKKNDIVVVFSDMRESGLSYVTVEFFSKLLSSVFNMAIDDDIILKNPVKRAIDEIEGTHKYRDTLSVEQQESLLQFTKNTNVSMYNKVYILLNTMCRISELAGLTWQDVDMKNKYITISHQLKREKVDGKYKFVIRPTKNRKERCIPMTDEIYSVFYNMRKYYFINRKDYEVDGKKDFIFLSQKGYLLTSSAFLAELKSLVKQYNISAEHPINEICTHTLRHTGCTRNAEQGMDIKVLQYLMGHSNSNITNNVYNHVNAERARKEILGLNRENMA